MENALLTRSSLFVLMQLLPMSARLFAQDPYIVDTEGLGQYGYLEKDAVTYVRLNANSYNNIDHLAARFYVTPGAGGQEWIYNTGYLGCANGMAAQGSTSDFDPGNFGIYWAAGSTAYVSVYAYYCGGGSSHSSGSTGFNERIFRIIDVDNAYSGGFDPQISPNPTGTDNIVGSFTIKAGSLSGLSLTRLWIRNNGTAQETTDIPNGGIRVYYETATGSETYNGNEPFVTLFGNYNGNSTTNNEWGNDALALSIPSGTGLRLYVVVASLATGSVNGRTADFELINDGISLNPAQNGKNLVRVNALDLNAATSPVLPVSWLGFTGDLRPDGTVELHWSTATERDNALFRVERSADARTWTEIGRVPGRGITGEAQRYAFSDERPLAGANYYRLAQVDFDGATTYSAIVTVRTDAAPGVPALYPNPLDGAVLWLQHPETEASFEIRAYTAQGQVLRSWTVPAGHGAAPWPLDVQDLPTGVLFFVIDNGAPLRVMKH